MSKKRPVSGTQDHAVATAAGAQRIASFVVEVLLDEEGSVRRTSVLHVADNVQESWPSWEPQALVDFMAERSAAGSVRPREQAPGDSPDGLRLEDVAATSAEPDGGLPLLVEGGAFEVQATLDPGASSTRGPIEYQAVVHAKTIGASGRQTLGEARGQLGGGDRARLRLPARAPAPGLYRLEVDVTLGGKAGDRRASASGGLLQVT